MKPFFIAVLFVVFVAGATNYVSAQQSGSFEVEYTTSYGSTGSGDGQFNEPNGIAVDGLGNVYVADMDNNRVEVFDSSGHFIYKFGSFGSNSSQFADPNGIAVSNSGNVHVVDMNNNRVQIFHADYNGAPVAPNSYAWSGNSTSTSNSPPGTTSANTTSGVGSDTTSITITPNPIKALEGSIVHYTATVTDTSEKPDPPSGIVSWFARTNVGQFQSDSCILVQNSTNSAESSCTVSYTTPAYCSCSVPVTIVASYQGDNSHQTSSSSAFLNSTGLTSVNVHVIPSENQVTGGSSVQITVTVTNSSGSVIALPSLIFIKPVEANALQFVHTPSPIITKYVNIAGIQVPDVCVAAAADISPPGTFCGAFSRGTLTPSSCTLSASGCIFTYTPPIDYHGPVLLMGRFLGKFPYMESYGNATIQVNPSGVSTPPPPSYANMIIAQNGTFAVRFASAFGTSGYGDGQMALPQGIALDQSGNVYVAQEEGKRVDKFDSSGHLLSKIGQGILTSPTNVAVDKSGNVYVVDISSESVYKFDSSGNLLSKLQPYGKCDVGNPTAHNIEPQGLALDDSGNVYITDLCDIQKYDSNGNSVLTFGSFGTGDGQFTGTGDIAVDNSGYIYVADNNQRIDKFDTEGKFQGWIGNCSDGTNCDTRTQATTSFCTDCTALGQRGSRDGQFMFPQAVALDKSGNMWITDMDNSRIEVFDSSGKFLFTFGTAGSNLGQFNDPNDIVFDNSDNLYVTDQNNGRVQVFHIEYGAPSSSQPPISSQDVASQSVAGLQPTSQPPTTPEQSAPTQTTQVVPSQSSIQLNAVPALSSISKAPGWVREIYTFRDKGEISDADLLNAINFLIQQDVVKLD